MNNFYLQALAVDEKWILAVANGPFYNYCEIEHSDTVSKADFEADWLPRSNKNYNLAVDRDGAQIVNPKFAGDGRGYQSLHFEMTLGSKNFYCKNYKLEDVDFIQVLHYKSETELLAEGDPESLIVKSVVILQPTFDYDIQGFCLYQKVQPVDDIKMWAVMVPFLPPEYGGPKELISGACLDDSPYGVNFLDYVGDSATTMKNMGPGTNEMMLIFRFPAGTTHKVMGELFWYV
jgi:hypothetical protein